MVRDYKMYSTNQNFGNRVDNVQVKGDMASVFGSTDEFIYVSDDLYIDIMKIEVRGYGSQMFQCAMDYGLYTKEVVLFVWVPYDRSYPFVAMVAECSDIEALTIAKDYMDDIRPIPFYR